MTVEEQVRKLNDWYDEHKDEIEKSSPQQYNHNQQYNHILKLLYSIYYTDWSKDMKQSLLGSVICEMIDLGDTITDLEHIADFWRNDSQGWADLYYEQLNDDC